jgi:hypothetical protein
MNALRPIWQIAKDISNDWGKKVSVSATPYLDAMFCLTTPKDSYMFDSGQSVVLYFLANASTYRGDKAKQYKQELRDHLNAK